MIRQPAFSGSFYPAEPVELRQALTTYVTQVKSRPKFVPKALIVPHAGYIYSGRIAASAYALLESLADSIHRVVLLGPSHRVALRGLATSSASAFHTPLGDVVVEQKAVTTLADFLQVTINDGAHHLEHSLEVQLPFLQAVLKDFEIVPLVVGETAPQAVAEVLDCLWGGPETLIVVSSDLSHYLSYAQAQQKDAQTTAAIAALDEDKLDKPGACGFFSVCGLLMVARSHQLKVRVLDVRNSGDTAGDKTRVVGYGAYAFL